MSDPERSAKLSSPPMSSAILPSIHNAHVTVDVSIDRVSDAFDVGSQERKRCLYGIGKIHAFPSWRDAPTFDLWQSRQPVMIALKPQAALWIDDEDHPMMGYIEGLSTEFRKPEYPVIVNLALTTSYADEVFRFVDAAVARTHTRVVLSMRWRFVDRYKSVDGRGSGASLWYPQEVSLFRETSSHTSEKAEPDARANATGCHDPC